jgi:FAD/FMN-containing dehydrogenase
LPYSSPTLSIAALRAELSGRVIGPNDSGYDEARTVFLGSFDDRPAVILRPANPNDVARSIALARETGLPLAVRSGGHSGAGHSTTDGGIVIDVRDLVSLEVDAEKRTAWAGTGLSAGAYSKGVNDYGLATGFGDTGSVGIGGITLSGGIGYLTRKYGMTIDNVVGAEVVTAGGEVLTVDEQSHQDLFWAIRGGGGNFGVVTRFKYKLHPVDHVYGGMLMLPATADVIRKAVEITDAAPEELTAIVNVMSAPPMPFIPQEHHGKLVVMFLLCYAGDAEAGANAVAPLRALAQPLADMVRPIRYPELFPPDEHYHPLAVARTLFLDHVDGQMSETMLDYLRRSDAPMRVVQLRALGGAMARVPSDATAFAHRKSRILVSVASFYTSPADRPIRAAWVAELSSALEQDDKGAYVGFLADEGEARVRAAYPEATWDRLAEVKARYDPENLFRRNQNVPPAA